ncbi:hypothetical protein ACJIZ3_002636 [Penstemon smallii]|uniref:Deoxyuridine 5'-triphosphate nucleotidohydrolase n=1 Tax=Penstemon smallii TaxID=265156 RepID=A0ABD3U9S4_9LAMI
MAGNFGAIFSNPVFKLPFKNPYYYTSNFQSSHKPFSICRKNPFQKTCSMAQEIGNNSNRSPEIQEPAPKIPKLHQNGDSEKPPNEIASFLRVIKLSEKAVLPSRGSPLSAGYDLSSAAETKVPSRGKALVPTDLSIAIPQGTYARVAPRSGLAWKHSIDVGAGVIDADYRGPVGVILFNHSDVDFEVKVGDRIAQLIIEKIMTPEVTEVKMYTLKYPGTPTVDQYGGRPIGTKKAKKGKGKTSASSNQQCELIERLRSAEQRKLMLEARRNRMHAQMLAQSEKEEENEIMSMDISVFTPNTRAYWKDIREEIQQKRLRKNLFGGSSNLGNNGFNHFPST